MDIVEKDSKIILKNPDSFDLAHIFECGQCFRFNRISEESFRGVVSGKVLTITQKDDDIVFENTSFTDFKNVYENYFDLSCDYSEIKSNLSKDPVLKEAISFGGGIRILKQDLWETVVSFIISASNNIPRIKKIIESFCCNFGKKIIYDGKEFYSFPTPAEISNLTLEDLGVIKAGYRDKYILDARDKFLSGEISYEKLKSLSYTGAKKELLKIKGVGNKVADCILLFGLSKTDSFPVDVWVKRVMEHFYFEGEQSIPEIERFAKRTFGNLGGYAQQYLFFYARENKIG